MHRDDVDLALAAADAAPPQAWLQHLQTAQEGLADMLPRACAQAAAALAERHRHGGCGSRVCGEAAQAMTRLHPAVAREALRALAPGFERARSDEPPARNRPFDLNGLRLLDDGEAQGEVEIALLARQLRDAAGLSVLQLTARQKALHRDSGRTGDNSPLGAAALAQALWAGCEGLGLTLRAQAETAGEIAIALAEPLDGLYRRLIATAARPPRSTAALPAARHDALLRLEPAGAAEPPRHATLSELLTLTRPAEWPADTMPVPADDDDARVPQLIHRHRSELAALPQRDSDWALMELISRLFGLILDDESLPAEVRALLGPLQARVVQLARRDPDLLESHRHPVWVFINKVTSQTVALQAGSDEQAGSFARFLAPLIGEIGPEPDGAAFERATQRLRRWQRSQALRQLTEHAPALDHLRLQAEQEPAVEAARAQRAPMLSARGAPGLDALETGDSVRLQLQGHWVVAQLLWTSDNGQFMLFGSSNGGRSHSFTRRAFQRLIVAGLVLPLEDRSALERATDRLSQSVQ